MAYESHVRPAAVQPLLAQWVRDCCMPKGSKSERPNYFYRAPNQLLAKAHVSSFITGSGDDVFAHIAPQLDAAEAEIVIITCFWARSSSRGRLCEALRRASARALEAGKRIKVFIGLSSLSLLQKLFHTTSTSGHTYPPAAWNRKLGLPPAEELRGLDLTVKSIFVRPFSVMHPKFVIVDRKKVYLPSCNVSWETWFEGCVELSGPVVGKFVEFWESFWLSGSVRSALHKDSSSSDGAVDALFLPSPHHVNPRFRPLPWQSNPAAPSTPLNTFLLNLVSHASTSIYIQTPNVTAQPVLAALLDAVQRGVNVHIVTSERLMVLEQLITAGTTTSRCVNYLVRRYKGIVSARMGQDEEVGDPSLGELRIEYYTPRPDGGEGEPVQSHLKLTIVDRTTVVLGSGNMDRASWFTSQELGVAIFDEAFAAEAKAKIEASLVGRTQLHYNSHG